MKKHIRNLGFGLFCTFVSGGAAFALPQYSFVLLDTQVAQILGIETLKDEPLSGVSLARVRPEEKARLSYYSHAKGRCGGFELLDFEEASKGDALLEQLRKEKVKALKLEQMLLRKKSPLIEQASPEVLKAFEDVSAANQERWVSWLSTFETRHHASAQPNRHVAELKAKLESLAVGTSQVIEIAEITHERTQQKSLRARIVGKSRPNETVVVGGHLDSIAGWSSRGRAPGADDNASGSSNVIEAFRLMLSMPRPERSVEFFWYAAEEIGLVGSAEIARSYKQQNRDVIGVLQLDMTLFPGDGPFVLASMQDFTSPWLREMLIEINSVYNIGATILADRCGYACSDHASWYRQGYPALMPFESSFAGMNNKIHTINDTITSASNFSHSAMFTKIAIAFSWELANSTQREPKFQ
jgi:leucyl aminopeptidase